MVPRSFSWTPCTRSVFVGLRRASCSDPNAIVRREIEQVRIEFGVEDLSGVHVDRPRDPLHDQRVREDYREGARDERPRFTVPVAFSRKRELRPRPWLAAP